MVRTNLNCSKLRVTSAIAPSRSVMLARVIWIACGNPLMSTAKWRLMPEIFLPPSEPLFSAVAVFLMLWASKMTNEVRADRPCLNRRSATIFLKPELIKLVYQGWGLLTNSSNSSKRWTTLDNQPANHAKYSHF